MSRIFDVLVPASGMYFVQSSCGNQKFRASKYGVKGPNQILLPTYVDPQEEELLTMQGVDKFSKVETNLDEVARKSHDKQILAHRIDYASGNLQVVKSQVHQYVDANSHYADQQQVLQLSPNSFVPSNKATYYLHLKAVCSKMDFVEISLGTGDTLHINGEFELYGRDKSLLTMIARIPARASFRVSYSQILPQKDTILKLLSRSQYGQSPLQP